MSYGVTNSELIAAQLADAADVQRIWGGLMYNVVNHGIVGNGITNNTSALQALINEAIAAGRRTIFFPHGVYFVESLINADQVDFVGDNSTFVGGFAGTIEDLGGNAALKADFEKQYKLKLRDIKNQYGAVFTIGANGGVFQTRDGSRIFCPMILHDDITKMVFKVVDGDTWLFLGGLEATYTFISVTGGLTGNVQNATSISTVGSIGTAPSTYRPTVGDTLSVERQAGKYVFSKKNSNGLFSVFMTVVDTDFPTANFNTHKMNNLGLVAHNGNTGANGVIKDVVLNFDSDLSQSSSGSGGSSGSFWKGKKYNAFGDSFTRFNNYQLKIQDQLGIGIVNSYGVDGSTIADVNLNNPDAFSVRYATMDPTADLVTFFGGTNDFSYNVPLGTINDTTRATFYGALRVLLEGVTSMMPSARIIMFTPMQRDMKLADFPGETPGLGPNTAGFTLMQYVDAIIQVCGIYSVPVYDIYRKSGVNTKNIETFTKVISPPRNDRLHPNEAGFVLLARQMAKFIDQC